MQLTGGQGAAAAAVRRVYVRHRPTTTADGRDVNLSGLWAFRALATSVGRPLYLPTICCLRTRRMSPVLYELTVIVDVIMYGTRRVGFWSRPVHTPSEDCEELLLLRLQI